MKKKLDIANAFDDAEGSFISVRIELETIWDGPLFYIGTSIPGEPLTRETIPDRALSII